MSAIIWVVLRTDPLPEIERLYRTELARFVRMARAIVGEEQAACDVVQEAFTRAVGKRRSFRRRGPLEAADDTHGSASERGDEK